MKYVEQHWRGPVTHLSVDTAIGSVIDYVHSDDQIGRTNERIDNIRKVLAAIIEHMETPAHFAVMRDLGFEAQS